MGRCHPARWGMALAVGLAVCGCHDWTTAPDAPDDTLDAVEDGGSGEVPPDAVDFADVEADAFADQTIGEADDAGPEAVAICGNEILEPGEDCERGMDVECTTWCGSRSTAECPEDCRAPSSRECPTQPERCNGMDDDCNGTPDDGAGLCPGCVVVADGGRVYHFCAALSWVEASATCRDRGLHLVTIDDDHENSQVSTIASTLGPTHWWMGFNDRAEEGTWVWESPSLDPAYTNWADGQPDNSGEEDCGELLYLRDQWNDAECDGLQPFVCEYP